MIRPMTLTTDPTHPPAPPAASAPADAVHPEAASAPGYLANHAARVFNRLVDAELRPHGLSMALIGPLLLLRWQGALRQSDLVRGSAVRQPAMVALLAKLESMGLIERRPAPADRRAATVDLTEKGRRMAEVGADALRRANALGTEGLSPEEVAQLVHLLGRLIGNLENAAGAKIEGTEHHF
jgi:MarR family transcriptional regulator, transcriptional regulator for hemolysin